MGIPVRNDKAQQIRYIAILIFLQTVGIKK